MCSFFRVVKIRKIDFINKNIANKNVNITKMACVLVILRVTSVRNSRIVCRVDFTRKNNKLCENSWNSKIKQTRLLNNIGQLKSCSNNKGKDFIKKVSSEGILPLEKIMETLHFFAGLILTVCPNALLWVVMSV